MLKQKVKMLRIENAELKRINSQLSKNANQNPT